MPEENGNHSNHAYASIRSDIMLYRLPPGAIVNEGELAASMNVSRTPVHEAVLRLRDEGLIDVIPRKESRVSRISIPLANEGMFFRNCVELEVFQLAINHVPPLYLQQLQENLSMQKDILDSGNNIFDYYAVDDEFHKLIFESVNYNHSYRCMQLMVTPLNRIRYLVRVTGDFGIEKMSYYEHKALLSYLAYGKPLDTDLHQYLYKHISRCKTFLDSYVEKYPDYFTFD